MTLSPADREALKGCSVYAVVSLYVRPDRLVSRVLRLVESLGGHVLSVDEEQRVVRANVAGSALEALAREAGDLLAGSGAEVKLSCRGSGDLRSLARKLSSMGFRVEMGGERLLAYGVARGRYVEVEALSDGRVRVKVGRRAFPPSKRLTARPPPTVFVMSLEEAASSLGEALEAAGAVLG